MLVYFLKRSFVALLVAITVSIISFMLLHLSGDLAQALAGPSATAADVAQVRKSYGLDRPLPVQYLEWAGKALSGDFGRSFSSPSRSASSRRSGPTAGSIVWP